MCLFRMATAPMRTNARIKMTAVNVGEELNGSGKLTVSRVPEVWKKGSSGRLLWQTVHICN